MSPSPDPDELLLVGRLAKSHGIKGEVKMVPESEYPERLLGLKRIFVGRDPVVSSPFVVEHARLQPTRGGSYLLLRLEGISTREQADQLRGMVYAPESDLPLEEDEFFLHDLIGLEVETEDGTPVGIITDLLDLPGHAVYVIGREGLPDALVPAVQEFISDIDLEKGRVVIRPIEGLLE